MNYGILWHDESKTCLKEKILQAAEYYRRQFNRAPELVLISPKDREECPDLKTLPFEGGEIAVREWSGSLHDHFWIGFEHAPVEVT